MEYQEKILIESLEKDLSQSEALLAAWQHVKFLTAKDGKPFKIMSKNFENADYRVPNYCNDHMEHELAVSSHGAACGYCSDSIRCFHPDITSYYCPDEIKEAANLKPQNVVGNKYIYDIEDIKAEIAARKDYWSKKITELRYAIQIAPVVFEKYSNAIKKAKDELIEDCKGADVLESCISETIRANAYHYL